MKQLSIKLAKPTYKSEILINGATAGVRGLTIRAYVGEPLGITMDVRVTDLNPQEFHFETLTGFLFTMRDVEDYSTDKEHIVFLEASLKRLYNACIKADELEELSEHIDGVLLDQAAEILKMRADEKLKRDAREEEVK